MKEDVIQHSGKPAPAHCSVVCAPAGVVLVEPVSVTTSDQVHDLIVAGGMTPTGKTPQDIKQIVIDVLTMLVLPPVTADIIICSHSDDNTNPDMTCDYSLYKEIRPQTRTFHIPEVIEPNIIMIEDYEYNATQRHKRQQKALTNRLNQQYKNNNIKHKNNIFYQYNIKHK